jgi:hypothetical protein
MDVFYARSLDGGLTFSAPANISQAYFDAQLPRIAIEATGAIVNVVWMQATTATVQVCCGREVFFSRSVDGGASFSTPTRISALQDSNNPAIATDLWGNVINVVWWLNLAGGQSRHVYFARSTDGGATFSPAKFLADGTVRSIASDSSGMTLNVAYVLPEGIRFIRSTDGGATFSSPIVISKYGYGPNVVADATGNLIDLVWSEGGWAKQWIRFARSSNGGQTFSKPLTIANVSQRYVVRPDLAVDLNGAINTIWAEWSSDTSISDIYYARGTP